jgi:hypothetical protein
MCLSRFIDFGQNADMVHHSPIEPWYRVCVRHVESRAGYLQVSPVSLYTIDAVQLIQLGQSYRCCYHSTTVPCSIRSKPDLQV